VIACDAVVVGGGPGGSTCARILRRAGWDVVVLDRATFPRDKVCAGWLTPEVFDLLELAPDEYRATGATLQEITAFHTGLIGGRTIATRYDDVVSYAIRRCEFDAFLLRRSGARTIEATALSSLRREGERWIVNEAFDAGVVIGAGGHFCPVAKQLRARSTATSPIVAKEAEFPLRPEDAVRIPEAPELFFCRDLDGYGWSVRKGGYLNVGIGRRDSEGFNAHLATFVGFLEQRLGLALRHGVKWHGHAYLAGGAGARRLVAPGMLVVGDAAGLAYPESGEGIRPAIESGRLAGETLAAAGRAVPLDALRQYEAALRRLYPAVVPTTGATRAASVALGRVLLGSRLFTRHVVLDRWFLRH
jgi:menaquinone-9 beta-reductase